MTSYIFGLQGLITSPCHVQLFIIRPHHTYWPCDHEMSLAAVVHSATASARPPHVKEDHTNLRALSKPTERVANDDEQTVPDIHFDDNMDEEGKDLPTDPTTRSLVHFRTPPDTPAMRTGPPRSLSFAYALQISPSASRNNSYFDNGDILQGDTYYEDVEHSFSMAGSEFRGALENFGLKEQIDRKGKKRESRSYLEDSWNPMRWFQESPKEEKLTFDFPPITRKPAQDDEKVDGSPSLKQRGTSVQDEDQAASPTKSSLRRAFSVPHSRSADSKNSESKPGRAKWSRLRSLLPHMIHPDESILPGPSAVTSQAVNITDELIAGGLSTLMLRLWFERDEKDHRRIPILFHRLRIRISDSLHPMHGHKSVFRIECEYANGAARWVIYRELRDFISLHAHYTVANVYNRNMDNIPEFPRTSIFFFVTLRFCA